MLLLCGIDVVFHGRVSAHDYESFHRGRAIVRGLLPVSKESRDTKTLPRDVIVSCF